MIAVATGSLTFRPDFNPIRNPTRLQNNWKPGRGGKFPSVPKSNFLNGLSLRRRRYPTLVKSAGFDHPQNGAAEVAARAGAGRRELPRIEGFDRAAAAA